VAVLEEINFRFTDYRAMWSIKSTQRHRVTHLVVVPGRHVDQRAVDDVGALRVDGTGVRVAVVVAGDERLIADREHSFQGPFAAVRKASFTSSMVVFFVTVHERSTSETLAVGTRSAIPSILPLTSGIAREVAFAAPVVVE